MRLFFILCIGLFALVGCQDFGKLKIIASVPASLEEISGIEHIPQSELIWAVSDSHNDATLFGFDAKSQSIKKVLNLHGITNEDWEDLAADTQANIYIGDFGNNKIKRKELAIYKVPNVSEEKEKITVYTTTFTLEDQTEFPPKKKHRNFDVEGFIFYKNNFYLFTRNRSSKFDGTVKLYKLPATPGHHTAKVVGTYKTCDDKKHCQVTGATINFNTGMVVLQGFSRVWVLQDYKGDDFFSGSIQEIDLGHHSQKESVCFKNDTTLYIADEQNGVLGGNVYELTLNMKN